MLTSPASPVADVVVIGGGIAGLTVAFDCARRGLRPVVLEATERPGGSVARHTVAGIELDAGAESFATARPAVAELLGDLGIAERIVEPTAAPAWVRYRDGSAPLPAGALLGIPGRPLARDVRRVIGTAGAVRASMDRLLPPRLAAEDLGRLVRRRMGTRVLHRLVEPVVGGVHAADPSGLEVAAIAPGLLDALGTSGSLAAAVRLLRGGHAPGAAVAGIDGGMAELTLALISRIGSAGGELRCGAAVTGVQRATGGGWLMHLRGSTVAAAQVVFAVPWAQARVLLAPLLATVVGVPLPAAPASARVRLATLVIDDPRLDRAPRGPGILVAPRASGVTAKALTHATAKWRWLADRVPAHRHVLRLSYGRGSDPGAGPQVASSWSEPQDTLIETALADAGELLGVRLSDSSIAGTAVVSWDSALPQGAPGHRAAVAGTRAALDRLGGCVLVGNWAAGNGLAAVISDARHQAARLGGSAGRDGTR